MEIVGARPWRRDPSRDVGRVDGSVGVDALDGRCVVVMHPFAQFHRSRKMFARKNLEQEAEPHPQVREGYKMRVFELPGIARIP